ncbi:hypothetical protein C2845_PM05G37630 [Panicum miliaceum]|uniref:Uncharacterized protein n=1 Tax=Panicum miliaceum TaxID=4540 RepID=A0A3L6T1L0_PANMI|nr:hypothetical protein C2845_PM05G37630 [Panicum miliaceum]
MMCAWMRRENMLLDYNISASDELDDCEIIRCRTLEVMVVILLEESSNFATSVKSDNGVSASETDQGGNGNDITAASEAVKSTGCLERSNCQDETIVDSVKTKRRKKTKRQMTKNLAVTKKRNRNRQRNQEKLRAEERTNRDWKCM